MWLFFVRPVGVEEEVACYRCKPPLLSSPSRPFDTPLSAAGVVFGCWLGAFFIPLDWDRPWQVSSAAFVCPCSSVADLAAHGGCGRRGRCALLACKCNGAVIFPTGYIAALVALLIVHLLRTTPRGDKKESE